MTLKAHQEHDAEVTKAQKQLNDAFRNHSTIERTKDKGAVSHSTRPPVCGSSKVSMAGLNGILGREGDHVWVEPGVTMEKLCRWSLQHGMMPPVVPEFRHITVAGAVMGAALESSSFKHGQFSDICDAYDLLLGDGSLRRVTADSDPDLFYGVSGSYGSIATLVAAKVRLVSAQAAVRVTYHVVEKLDDVTAKFEELIGLSPDFLDAIVLSPNRTVVMAGWQTSVSKPTVKLGDWWRPWFVQHVTERVEGGNACEDYISLEDYLFRYDRGAFWMGQFCTSTYTLARYLMRWRLQSPELVSDLHKSFSEVSPTLKPSLAFRLAFGSQLTSKNLYKVLHLMPSRTWEETFHVQDFYIPTSKLALFLEHLSSNVEIYPLWLGPMRGTGSAQILSPHYLKDESRFPQPDFVNVGVYGVPSNGRYIPEVCRELEVLTHKLGGRKMLYAQNSIPEDEFWQIYDRTQHQTLRDSAMAKGVLVDFYAKTHGKHGSLR